MTKHTPSACLTSIAITASHLDGAESLEEEFRIIKKVYHEKILKEHPDKGGDPATFRETRAAFEVLRSLYQENTVKDGTFGSYFGVVDDDMDIDELFETYATSDSYPSYSYYEEAAATPVPGYRVEKAKSGRSRCKSKTGKQECGGVIPQESIRVGSVDDKTGSYGRWHHLISVGGPCKGWRVPMKVWSGLTDPSDVDQTLVDLLNMEEVLLCGLASLDGTSQKEFALHCMQEENWAGHKRKAVGDGEKAKKKSKNKVGAESDKLVVAGAVLKTDDDDQKPPAKASSGFSLPNSESNSTVDSTFLKTYSFLITGSFPELVTGSSNAKDAGVGDVKVLIESFGGKVTTRFSKKTSYLIVGKDPSRSRFSDAETREIPLLTLNMLSAVLSMSHSFADVESMPVLAIESLEGTSYKPGGGALPALSTIADHSNKLVAASAKKQTVKKPSTATKSIAKMPSAKTAAKAKRVKPPPSDRASVASAALAAAAASKHANRAIKAAPAPNVIVRAGSSMSTSSAMVPAASRSSTSTALSTGAAKARFTIPKPGVNGAISGIFNGKRFVLTGVFPEVGGGSGLNQGKDRMKEMIASFGGTVTGSVSGKTDYVVIGRSPGASKVGKAHQRGLPLLDILSLERIIYGRTQLEQIANEPPPRIESFSSGYGGNGLLTGGDY